MIVTIKVLHTSTGAGFLGINSSDDSGDKTNTVKHDGDVNNGSNIFYQEHLFFLLYILLYI